MKEKVSRRDFLRLISSTPLGFLRLPEVQVSTEAILGRTPGVIYEFETSKPAYAVTVDDGFYPDQLVATLEGLKLSKIQATFFLVGYAAIYCENTYPGVLQRLVDEGHYLAYHTMSHPSIETLLSADVSWFKNDYENWNKYLRKYIREDSFGTIKSWARAPWGLFNKVFMDFCQTEGLLAFGWSADEGTLSRGIPLNKGDIVLFHARATSVEWLNKLKEVSSLEPVAIDSLMKNNIIEQNRLKHKYKYE